MLVWGHQDATDPWTLIATRVSYILTTELKLTNQQTSIINLLPMAVDFNDRRPVCPPLVYQQC